MRSNYRTKVIEGLQTLERNQIRVLHVRERPSNLELKYRVFNKWLSSSFIGEKTRQMNERSTQAYIMQEVTLDSYLTILWMLFGKKRLYKKNIFVFFLFCKQAW